MKMVLIEWVDSNILHGWITIEDAKRANIALSQSVGFLLWEDNEKVIIVFSKSDSDSVLEVKAIPRGCIKSIKELRVK